MHSKEVELPKVLRDFFERFMSDYLFHHRRIARGSFFDRFEYFIAPKDEDVTLSTDEKVKILLFLKDVLKEYIVINASDSSFDERFIEFFIDPCNMDRWQEMLDCIYDNKKEAQQDGSRYIRK